ncbi:MAG: Gfo/Idh/MocA family oxidoreductase [bacterium]|nr:Gfo/Idh/MocA family oxidoreductase [bacterium]
MKPIKTAIVGLGNITHGYADMPSVVKRMKFPTHLSALKQDKRFLLVAGSDPEAKSRLAFQKKVGARVNVYSDLAEMLAREKIGLLVIATPTRTHYEVATAAIKSGVQAILCEKPIASSVVEATKLIKLAKKHQVTLAVNYFRSFDAGYLRLRQFIKSQSLGGLLGVNVNYSNGILNTGTHLINILEKLVQPFDTVIGLHDSGIANSPDPTINFAAKMGAITVFFRGLNNSDYRLFEMDLFFKGGRVKVASDKLEQWSIHSDDGFSFLQPNKKSALTIDINRSLLDVYDNIYKHLNGGGSLSCTAVDAWHALSVADCAVRVNNSTRELVVPSFKN